MTATPRTSSAASNPEANLYEHYLELLSDPNFEAVVIAAPGHWHEKMVLDAVAAAFPHLWKLAGPTYNRDLAKGSRWSDPMYDFLQCVLHRRLPGMVNDFTV